MTTRPVMTLLPLLTLTFLLHGCGGEQDLTGQPAQAESLAASAPEQPEEFVPLPNQRTVCACDTESCRALRLDMNSMHEIKVGTLKGTLGPNGFTGTLQGRPVSGSINFMGEVWYLTLDGYPLLTGKASDCAMQFLLSSTG